MIVQEPDRHRVSVRPGPVTGSRAAGRGGLPEAGPKSHAAVILIALFTLGSGLVNLWSVIGPALHARIVLLRHIFPLEFIRLSRSVTLLTGFALIISSINIHKRKQRAFAAVSLLAAASVVFHLTKGLDYEEAALSASLLLLLWRSRRLFTVRSGAPEWTAAFIRLGVAALAATGYGIAGFWLLDPNQFGLNFTLADAARRTLLFLSLAGDPTIVPHTRYAQWFLDSLYLITAAAIADSGFALFRPVMYRLRTHPHECEMARRIVEEHGRSGLDYFKTWPDKSFFFSASSRAFLAYRVAGDFAVVLGDPVGPEEEIEALLRRFQSYCQDNDWRLGFHQVLPDLLPLYHKLGFRKLKIGDDAVVDLEQFSLEGKRAREFRNKVNQMERMGIRTQYYSPPLPEAVFEQLREISEEWLRLPGRRERQFTLGRFEPSYIRSTPVLLALDASGRGLGFLTVIPSYRVGEATVDLMRRRADGPNGIIDYLFIELFLLKKAEGFRWFNLGMAPMSGFQEHEQASAQERAVHTFFQHLNFLFSYKGLRAFKAKFATRWEPRYEIYRNVLDLPRLGLALRKVSEIRG